MPPFFVCLGKELVLRFWDTVHACGEWYRLLENRMDESGQLL